MNILEIKYVKIQNPLLLSGIILFISFCVGCSSIYRVCHITPQSKNGWLVIKDHPSSNTSIQSCRDGSPSICVSFPEGATNHIILWGPIVFFPIFPNPYSMFSNELTIIIINHENEIKIDIRDFLITSPDGKTVKFTEAKYCKGQISDYYCPPYNHLTQNAPLGSITLTEGRYIFELTFPEKLYEGESFIEFGSVEFRGKKYLLPPLLINKKIRIYYCPSSGGPCI